MTGSRSDCFVSVCFVLHDTSQLQKHIPNGCDRVAPKLSIAVLEHVGVVHVLYAWCLLPKRLSKLHYKRRVSRVLQHIYDTYYLLVYCIVSVRVGELSSNRS